MGWGGAEGMIKLYFMGGGRVVVVMPGISGAVDATAMSM